MPDDRQLLPAANGIEPIEALNLVGPPSVQQHSLFQCFVCGVSGTGDAGGRWLGVPPSITTEGGILLDEIYHLNAKTSPSFSLNSNREERMNSNTNNTRRYGQGCSTHTTTRRSWVMGVDKARSQASDKGEASYVSHW